MDLTRRFPDVIFVVHDVPFDESMNQVDLHTLTETHQHHDRKDKGKK